MTARLNGKVALVTGAAQGIGLSIVEAFVEQGARVVAADINASRLDELTQRLAVTPLLLDVTSENAIQASASRFSETNVLVNCAGFVATGAILTASSADLERCYRLNVLSVFLLTKAFLPAMISRRSGSIINIASVVSSEKAAVERCAYATSKGAVIALTKSIAMDVIKTGVRCNSISPGTVHTPSLDQRIAASATPEETYKALVARQPMSRLGEPGEIAALAVLLASDEAKFMTGSNLVIDGGFSL